MQRVLHKCPDHAHQATPSQQCVQIKESWFHAFALRQHHARCANTYAQGYDRAVIERLIATDLWARKVPGVIAMANLAVITWQAVRRRR